MSAVLSSMAMPGPWRRALPAFALAMLAVLLLYRDSFAGMVAIWSRSDTFAHAFLVPPIVAWLVWRQRAALRRMQPQPQSWLLLPIAAGCFAWLVGDLAGVNALTQFAATALLVLLVPALLGWTVARALLFPLCFLFFMVPFGEFVMPQLMQWTADVTVFALRLFGLPVYREGLQFVIPSGSWSVIEACSGVRYLIASFMVGTLFAYLNYTSPWRRLAFGVVSLLVPIAANWARAVMIVMLGHLSDNKLAAGVDHLIYGWLFFGVVIGVMFFIGSRWAEAPADAPTAGGVAAAAAHGRHADWLWPIACLTVVVLALPPAAAWKFNAADIATPRLVLPGLRLSASDSAPLHRPGFQGAKAEATRVYGSGPEAITVHVAYYRQQTYGHKLISSENMLVASSDNHWHRTEQGAQTIDAAGLGPVLLRTAELRSGVVNSGGAEQRLQVRQVYWVGGRLLTSDHLAALYAVADQLVGRGDDAAAITVYQSGRAADARALDAFLAQHLQTLSAWLDSVRQAR